MKSGLKACPMLRRITGCSVAIGSSECRDEKRTERITGTFASAMLFVRVAVSAAMKSGLKDSKQCPHARQFNASGSSECRDEKRTERHVYRFASRSSRNRVCVAVSAAMKSGLKDTCLQHVSCHFADLRSSECRDEKRTERPRK